MLDSIEASDSTRSGDRIAIVWAIMPPIELPTTCARSIPRWSSSPKASAAMSLRRYGTSTGIPAISAITFGTGART